MNFQKNSFISNGETKIVGNRVLPGRKTPEQIKQERIDNEYNNRLNAIKPKTIEQPKHIPSLNQKINIMKEINRGN